MSNQTKGLAALLAAHGRKGDTELMHVTKGEVAALNRLKRGIDGKDLPRNPRTGLHEANFFRNAMPYLEAAAPIIAGGAATALTGGAAAPALVGALAGGATGAGIAAAKGKSGSDIAIGGGLGAIGGVGGAGLASGLGAGASSAGASTASGAVPAATPGAAAPNAFAGGATDLLGTGGSSIPGVSTPAIPTVGGNAFTVPTSLNAPGSTAIGGVGGAPTPIAGTSPFTQGVQEGVAAYSGVPTTTAPAAPVTNTPADLAQQSPGTSKLFGVEPIQAEGFTPNPNVAQPQMSPAQGTVQGDKFVPNSPSQGGLKWDYLSTDKAAGDVSKVGIGGLGTLAMNQDNLNTSGTTDETDKTLPESEVYYTDTGERRTRIVDRPRFGNVNMARGGDVYGDYEGVDEAPDGGYRPGGGLNYAGGGLAGTGWGEQTQGGFAGLTSSLQPGGAVGDWHGKVYGALGADQVMPGGAGGSLIPGANQYNAKKRGEEERKRAEQEAGIAAAAKAKQEADFKQQWSDRYAQGMAEGGYTGPRDGDGIKAIVQAQQQKQADADRLESYRALWPIASVSGYQNEAAEMRKALDQQEQKRSAFAHPAIRKLAGQDVTQADFDAWNSQGYAHGGISALGHYSDGGQMLRGPGDGVSDSIPASIEGKRPARLADGEFVVPARAVSELGNGSTEAGSKQLYAMLDRIAKKRKSGKGLAYQANPKKMLPA